MARSMDGFRVPPADAGDGKMPVGFAG